MLGDTARSTEDFRELARGTGAGLHCSRWQIPKGYYKDPEKTAKTFPTINSGAYSIPGDWVQVRPTVA